MKFIITIAAFIFAGNIMTTKSAPITIRTKDYTATLAQSGYLSSITVAGKEFLSNSQNVPGGFYLCAGYISSGTLISSNKNSYTFSNDIADLNYMFKDSKIVIQLNNIKNSGSLYILPSPDIKQIKYVPGIKKAPILSTLPVTAACSQTRWYQNNTFLDIDGGSCIWGPWHDHQVWELKLKQGATNTVILSIGKENEYNISTPELKNTFTYTSATTPPQIPLCMIGDSITWAENGDYWRKYMLEHLPRLAFVGTHSAYMGYSHAGEGGNNTIQVLHRINNIPVCPYYSLLIGTNDNEIKNKEQITVRAGTTAENIQKIVSLLLNKKGVRKIFLCSILPCHTGNPIRNITNKETNKILRDKMENNIFPKDKVIWVEIESPILAISNWKEVIKLHPSKKGYKIIANILAESISKSLGINTQEKKLVSVPNKGTGVQIVNLIDSQKRTITPVISGFYTLSFAITEITDESPRVIIKSDDGFFKEIFLNNRNGNERISYNFFTGYEGYGYKRAYLYLEEKNCRINNILLEKMRPSKQPSIFKNKRTYIDRLTKPSLGELVEY